MVAYPNVPSTADRETIDPKKSPDNINFNIDLGAIPSNKKGNGDDGKKPEPNYNNNDYIAKPGDNVAKKAREGAAGAENPTTASADKNQDLPDAIKSADPQGKSQILPNLAQSLISLFMLLSMGNSSGTSSTRSTLNTPTGETIASAFNGALSILCKKYTSEKVLTSFDNGFGIFGITEIYTEYYDIVHAALSRLVSDIIYYGENKIPTPIIPTFTKGDSVPYPLYTFPPDMYIKQFDPQIEEEFPGYILWVGPDGDRVWTLRGPEDPPYSSATQEIYTTTSYEIAAALEPYVINNSVTPKNVNDALVAAETNIKNKSTDLSLGYNSSNNLMSNLTLILGFIGVLLQITQQLQVTKGVTDSGKLSAASAAFSRNMGIINQMKSVSASAFTPAGAVAGLGALSSIVNGLSSSGIIAPSGGGISSLVSGGSLNSILSTAAGAAVTVASVTNAMKYSGAQAATVVAAANLVKNLGISS